jgi:transcription initiation factor TFIIB
MKRKIMTMQEKCPRCGTGSIIHDVPAGELTCNNCGFVVFERVEDHRQERRSFTDQEENNRVGNPTSLAMFDMGLSTVIGQKDKDAFGKPLSSHMKETIERLRIWDSRSYINSSGNTLKRGLETLNKLKENLVLSDILLEEAAYIFRKSKETGLLRGRTLNGMVAGSLYAVCRKNDVPRTIQEVAKAADISKNELARSYRAIIKEFDLKMPVADPLKCVSRIASIAGLGEKVKRTALQIIDDATKKGILAGREPMGITASALYLSCVINHENKSQGDIARASGVTTATIKIGYHWLERFTRFKTS